MTGLAAGHCPSGSEKGMICEVRVSVTSGGSLTDVAAIEATSPSGASRFHEQRYERDDASTYLLAWVDRVAVGHVLVTPVSKYEEVRRALGRFPEVNSLGVAEAYRRQGVARSLMAAAADRARQMGGDRLGLAVDDENEPAMLLYESLGFERHPALEVVDTWAWTDNEGVEQVHRDLCTYWTRPADWS